MKLDNIMDVISTKYLLIISFASAVFIGINAMEDDIDFVSLDIDNNGVISYDEAMSNSLLHLTFKDADLNRDGVISAAEFNYTMIK